MIVAIPELNPSCTGQILTLQRKQRITPYNPDQTLQSIRYPTYYVNFENREMMIRFEKEVEQLTGRTTPMGVKEILLDRREKEGLEKGRELERTRAFEEKLEIARELKKEGLALDFIARTTKLSIAEIESL